MVIEKLRRHIKFIMTLSETSGIARRYFALNAFDGALIGLGAIFGFYISRINDYRVVFLTVSLIVIGSAISGFSGAFISERLEQEARLRRLEEAILTDLKDTIHHEAILTGTLVVSVINSISSLIGIFSVSAPYILSAYFSVGIDVGITGSIVIFLVLLGVLGYFFGKELKLGTIRTVVKILLAGAIALFIYFLIELIFRF